MLRLRQDWLLLSPQMHVADLESGGKEAAHNGSVVFVIERDALACNAPSLLALRRTRAGVRQAEIDDGTAKAMHTAARDRN